MLASRHSRWPTSLPSPVRAPEISRGREPLVCVFPHPYLSPSGATHIEKIKGSQTRNAPYFPSAASAPTKVATGDLLRMNRQWNRLVTCKENVSKTHHLTNPTLVVWGLNINLIPRVEDTPHHTIIPFPQPASPLPPIPPTPTNSEQNPSMSKKMCTFALCNIMG